MKVLAALSVVQIVAILFLLSKLMAWDDSVQALLVALQAGSVQQPAEPVMVSSEPPPVRGELNENLLRQVVRQELAAQLETFQSPGRQQDAPALADPLDEAEMQYRTDGVSQEIQFYVSRGTISELEMQHLQGEIAKLDKEGQKKMLGQLVRALNSGELKGRL